MSDFRRYIGDEMVALLRLIPGTVVLMISASLISLGDEADPGQNGSKKNQNGVEVLVREMRTRITRTIELRQQTGLQSNSPKFAFDVFADEHGLDESCQAVVTLLRDPDSLVREEAAKVAADWLKAEDLDEDILQMMLSDSSFEVRRLALKLLPESGLSLEPLFLMANDNSSEFQSLAMELLVPLIMKGNNAAKAVLSELITSTEARTAGQAILLTGTLKVQGRFAESKLREALSDERSFTITYLTAMCLSGESFSIDHLAAEALRETGFDDEATAEALRKVCDSAREKFATVKDENSWLAFDSRPWLSAAVTLAVRRRDFASIREAIFLRGNDSYRFHWPDTEAIRILLELAPEAITTWEHGERACRRLLNTPLGRSEGDNWIALTKYPNATAAFDLEMEEFLNEEAAKEESNALSCPFKEVVTFRASDGFSKDDLNYSLRLIGSQRRSSTDDDIDEADRFLTELMLANDMQLIAEMMMLNLVHRPSINPNQFRELLKDLPTNGGRESRSRQRLEAALDELQSKEE